MCGGGVATHHMRGVCVYGLIRRAGSTRHRATTPPRLACAVYESTGGKPVWGQTRVSSTIPSTSPLSTRHNCVISSQERKFSVPILSRSCLKFAVPRARVPKLPGTPECETRNARPSLPLWLSNLYYDDCIRNVSVTCT